MVIGIEAGATSAIGFLANAQGRILARARASGINNLLLRLASQCKGRLHAVRRLTVCMAGLSLHASPKGIVSGLRRECLAMGMRCKIEIYPDIFSTLASELGNDSGIVLAAGTGSCAMAQDGKGRVLRCGGWGRLLGDEGSGYAIGLDALKAVCAMDDGRAPSSALRKLILQRAGARRPSQLIAWSHRAEKRDIAALAPAVFAGAKLGDAACLLITAQAAHALMELMKPPMAWLEKRGIVPKRIVLTGGVIENHPEFSASLRDAIAQTIGSRVPIALSRGSKGIGALRLALGDYRPGSVVKTSLRRISPRSPSTESVNPKSMRIDTLPTRQVVRIIQEEDLAVPRNLLSQRQAIAQAADWIVGSLRKKGRVVYVGAGTSGRLAALDASELPPTFGLREGIFDVILAGGDGALKRSVERAEDDTEEGPRQLRVKQIGPQDIVIGIAASGTTPFVLAAMRQAKRLGAKTVGIACNAGTPLHRVCDLTITATVGPEVIAGSTRMKAGTATKLLLNTISTAAMIRLGKVYDHWMVDVEPSNEKLRARACRIVQGLTGLGTLGCRDLLRRSGGRTKTAVLMAKRGLSSASAEKALAAAGGNLRAALGQRKLKEY